MSVKYHVNPKTGRPGVCRAVQNCRFGDEKSHYDSKASAQKAIEEKLKELNVAPPISRKPAKPKEDVSQKSETQIKAERKKLSDMVESAKRESEKAAWDRVVIDDIINKKIVSGPDLKKLKESRDAAVESEEVFGKKFRKHGKELEEFDALHKDRLNELERTRAAREAADRISRANSSAGSSCDRPARTAARC